MIAPIKPSEIASQYPETIAIHERALPQRLTDYVRMLSTEYPFSVDIVFDKRDVIYELIALWPKCPKWEVEAQNVWAYIYNAVQTVSAVGTNERVLLQVRVGSDSSTSETHVESDEAIAVVAFNSQNGHVKNCLVPVMADVPDLDAEKSVSSILILCQPFQKLISKEHDVHLYSAKAGALYASRTLDNPLSTNTFQGTTDVSGTVVQDQRMMPHSLNLAKLITGTLLIASIIRQTEQSEMNTATEAKQNERTERIVTENNYQRITSIPSAHFGVATFQATPDEPFPFIKTRQSNPTPSFVIETHNNVEQAQPADILKTSIAPVYHLAVMDGVSSPPAELASADRLVSESGAVALAPEPVKNTSVFDGEPKRVIKNILPPTDTMPVSQTVVTTERAPASSIPITLETTVTDRVNAHDESVPVHPVPQQYALPFNSNKTIDSGAKSAVSSVADLETPSASRAIPSTFQEEPHRPVSSPLASANSEEGDHFIAATSVASTAKAPTGTTNLHEPVSPIASPISAQTPNGLDNATIPPVMRNESKVSSPPHGPVGFTKPSTQPKPINDGVASGPYPFTDAKQSSPSTVLNGATFSNTPPTPSGLYSHPMPHLPMPPISDTPHGTSSKRTPAPHAPSLPIHPPLSPVPPIELLGASANKGLLLAILTPKPSEPARRSTAKSSVQSTRGTQVIKKSKKANVKIAGKQHKTTKKRIVKKAAVSVPSKEPLLALEL